MAGCVIGYCYQNPAKLRRRLQLMMTLMNMGFTLKLEQCLSALTQLVVFLGTCQDSIKMSISVSLEKLDLLQSEW